MRLKKLRLWIANIIAPHDWPGVLDVEETMANLSETANNIANERVADILFKMDPFEPLLKKFNVVFSEEWQHPEDKLNEQSKTGLYMWAHGLDGDPNFRYLVDWIRNTQGNATLRKAKNDSEWFYGRAAIATITLLVDEIGRLSSHYKEILQAKGGKSFDGNLTVE